MKICRFCGVEHDRRSDYCSTSCNKKQYAQDNKDKLREKNKKYYEENKDYLKQQMKEYHDENKTDIHKRRKKHYELNKDYILLREKDRRYFNINRYKTYSKKSYNKNRDKILIKQKELFQTIKLDLYRKRSNRLKTDECFKISCYLRNRLVKAIRRNQKLGSAVKDLGCPISFFKSYLQSWFYNNPTTNEEMTWDNYGSKWHIDHTIPLASFDLTDREQFLKAVHFSNLKPMWAEENLSKGCR